MKNSDSGLSEKDLLQMYEKMILIRYFEDKVYELFANRQIPGTTHLCQGQEAVSVGVMKSLGKDDVITCTYRGHGHCLAKGVEPKKIMAEIMGKSTGCCGGKGGSMHIADYEKGALGSFGIVGAGIPIAAGAGLASWYTGSKKVSVSFFGDGAANIGAFHEGINFASIMKLPTIFVCENNLYGEYTHISKTTGVKDIASRASSYGIPGVIVDGNDVLKVYSAAKSAVDNARKGNGPTLLECKTYRQKGHSRTDPGKYRPDPEVESWMKRDPLLLFGNYLKASKILTNEMEQHVKADQQRIVEEAYQFALNSPYPDPKEITTHVYD
ncbi:MAG: thiamine pyrophosphate-dependent dehydrogenase E1 component subunit alpha [archaeon]|nr:thiamine pyrophosphate-dependent dehydrogenase E1 component subunit alpha [archaeon]